MLELVETISLRIVRDYRARWGDGEERKSYSWLSRARMKILEYKQLIQSR